MGARASFFYPRVPVTLTNTANCTHHNLSRHLWAADNWGVAMFGKFLGFLSIAGILGGNTIRQEPTSAPPVSAPKVRRLGAIPPGRPKFKQPPPKKPGVYRFVNKATRRPTPILERPTICHRRKREHTSAEFFKPNEHRFDYQLARDGITADELYAHEKKKTEQHWRFRCLVGEVEEAHGEKSQRPPSPVYPHLLFQLFQYRLPGKGKEITPQEPL